VIQHPSGLVAQGGEPMDDIPPEELLTGIDRAIEDLLASAGIREPPVDAIRIAQRHLGMTVCLDRRQRARGRAQRIAGLPQIFLRPEPREERHQWTVAHEIAEHLKVDLLCRLGIRPEATHAYTGESLANRFASRFLVPQCWFADDARDFHHDLLALKRRYRTASHEIIALRMLDLGEPCVVTICDNDRVTKRRSNSWRTPRQLEPIEERCWKEVRRRSEPLTLREGAWTVQGWPVHQLDWRREILRTIRDN
jgi:Zn-dependent peptidase ImmA (M78 family)